MIVDRAIYREGKRVGAPDTLAELNAACRNGAGIAWIGAYDPTEQEFATIAREFDLPELAVAHALDVHHRPKLEHYGDTLFLVLRTARYCVQNVVAFIQSLVEASAVASEVAPRSMRSFAALTPTTRAPGASARRAISPTCPTPPTRPLGVTLADKVHNARSIIHDYRAEDHALWDRFTDKTIHDQLWYYRALLEFFSARHPAPLVEDLRRALAELEDLAAHDSAATGA